MKFLAILLISSILASPVNIPTTISKLFSKAEPVAQATPGEILKSKIATQLVSRQSQHAALTTEGLRLQASLENIQILTKSSSGKALSDLKQIDILRLQQQINTKKLIAANSAAQSDVRANIDSSRSLPQRASSVVERQTAKAITA